MTASDNFPPLRPLRLRIAKAAHLALKPQYVLEKDYALSYLLAGIAAGTLVCRVIGIQRRDLPAQGILPG